MTTINRQRPRRRLPNIMVKNFVKDLLNSNKIFVEFIDYYDTIKKYIYKNFFFIFL